MASNDRFILVKSPFDLPTYQKRLRHLRSIAVRNLVCHAYRGIEVAKMQSFFTLHKDRTSKAFYTSEKVTGSVNPTWKSFDISRYEKDVHMKSKCMVLRVWVCRDEKHTLLIDITIYLSGLVFVAEKLQHTGIKYNPNSVIFGMFDKYFVSSEEANFSPHIQKQQTLDVQHSPLSPDIPDYVIKVEQSTIQRSYTSNSVSRIQTILRATKQTQAAVNKIHTSIEDRLLSSQETSRKLCLREQLVMKLSQLRSELMWQTTHLQTAKEKHEQLQMKNSKAAGNYRDQESYLEKSKHHHEEKKKSYVQSRESLVKETAQLLIRRKQLVGEMATYIYPILENKKKQLCICGVWLPNAEDYQGQDEVMVAISLSNTCHLTMMISQFLDIPLRYQLEYRGSRTQIRDHIHNKLNDKDRDFPLYSKGKEKFQFNYGVFLLNKNISQIRFYCGLGTTDLRLTLPNLKTLLELRLGVKLDAPLTRSLTPTSGTGNSITSSTAQDSIKSLAGSSSASSLVRKDDIISSQQADSANSDTVDSNSIRDSEYKENRVQKLDFDEKSTLFEGNEDAFFKISSPVTDTTTANPSDSGSLFDDYNKGIIDSQDVLIDQEEKVNNMETLKATLHIHFDNSDETSSPSMSYDEGDGSSGEDKLHAKQKPVDHPNEGGLDDERANSDIPEGVPPTFKTNAFRTISEKKRDSSPETILPEDYSNATQVVS